MRVRVIVDGKDKWLHDYRDIEEWLESCGTSFDEMFGAFTQCSDYEDEIENLRNCVEEQEMIADGHLQDLQMLCEELSAIADKLRSNKKGRGYTKNDLANAIDYAISCVSSI